MKTPRDSSFAAQPPHVRAHFLTLARASRRPASPENEITGEEDDVAIRKSRSVTDVAAKLWADSLAPPVEEPRLVLHIDRRRAIVLGDDGPEEADLLPALAKDQAEHLAVGDLVRRDGMGRVAVVEPRRTFLQRADPGTGRDRTMVANIDLVVAVLSVVMPPLHPRLLDRIGLAATRGGCRIVAAVNKIDLLGEDRTELDILKPYEAAGWRVIPVSVRTGEGIAALRAELEGRMSAFVGHSGVGKSSLLNRLAERDLAATGEVSAGYGRGTHTTRGTTLHDLGGGTRLIDTPGVRSFGIASAETTPEDAGDAFPDVAALAEGCRFRNCRHDREPGCAVRAAVDEGSFPPTRYAAYRAYENLPPIPSDAG